MTHEALRAQIAAKYGVPIESVGIEAGQVVGAPDRLVILVNNNVKMTPRKLAAQAVHAALTHHGIAHGTVVVLGATPSQIRARCLEAGLVYDAGVTEVTPGTLTAGVER